MYLEKTTLKQKMIKACMLKQQQEINGFKKEIRSLLESKMVINEEDTELSQQAILEANLLADDIKIVKEDMHLLNNLLSDDFMQEKIALGSVVITDRETFFISGSSIDFKTNGNEIVGLSSYSPLFREMEGKRKGDTFIFRNRSYTVVDVF